MHNPISILKNRKIEVLYIKNSLENRDSIATVLEKFFAQITEVEDLKEVYNEIKESKFDFIIIENINVNILKKIRDIDKNIFILIISESNNIEYLLESIKHHVYGYLVKPLDNQQFYQTILNLVDDIERIKKEKRELNLLKEYQKIIDKSSIISKTDKRGIITYVNDNFCKISGYSREELIGRNHNIVRAKDVPSNIFRDLWNTIKIKRETWEGVLKNRTKDNGLYYVKATIKPILNEKREIEEYIAIRSVITDIIHPKRQLLDFLRLADEYIMILIKIEHFDYIQSSLDKDETEEIENIFVKEVFKAQPNKNDFQKIYLLDNGEFAFAKRLKDCTKSISDIIEYLNKFQENINSRKIHISSINHNISILISFAYGRYAFRDARAGIKQLIETREEFIVANGLRKKEKKEALKHIKTFNLLREAIDSYNIVSYFQPIVNNKTKQIDKYESLVRLVDCNNNILSPALFLDSAKKSKYYSKITSMVLRNSFQALYDTQMTISINLSAIDIEQPQTKKEFFSLLAKHNAQAHRVIVELIEDEDIKDVLIIKDFIDKVREFGVQIAIDDFGAGLSNFSRVLQYQPDYIKIDGSLIKDIYRDNLARDMVDTIVHFAKRAKIKTVAEFVENEKIFDILCDLGVDYSQGYYFGRAELLKK
jgi:PAS domain S-box-containing protein